MKLKHDGRLWEVFLCDDGTMDTVISVQPVRMKSGVHGQNPEYYPIIEERFDCEFASQYRRADGSMTLRGLRELGKEAIESYAEDLAE